MERRKILAANRIWHEIDRKLWVGHTSKSCRGIISHPFWNLALFGHFVSLKPIFDAPKRQIAKPKHKASALSSLKRAAFRHNGEADRVNKICQPVKPLPKQSEIVAPAVPAKWLQCSVRERCNEKTKRLVLILSPVPAHHRTKNPLHQPDQSFESTILVNWIYFYYFSLVLFSSIKTNRKIRWKNKKEIFRIRFYNFAFIQWYRQQTWNTSPSYPCNVGRFSHHPPLRLRYRNPRSSHLKSDPQKKFGKNVEHLTTPPPPSPCEKQASYRISTILQLSIGNCIHYSQYQAERNPYDGIA